MPNEAGTDDFRKFEMFRRYVPLLAWVIGISVVVLIPLKIISDGYLPIDDASRHAAYAVSGKPWQEILVVGPSFGMDHLWGWHWLLREIYLLTHCSTDMLVVVPVVGLFVALNLSVMACLKRPEAWLAAFVLVLLASGLLPRFLMGRPLMLSMMGLMVILLVWQRHGDEPPKWRTVAWMAPLIAITIFLHGVWYLWVLPIAAFFLAQQFRWCLLLTVSWVAGTFLGSVLTGHPIESILQAVEMAVRAFGMPKNQLALATESRPSGGDIFSILLLGGLVVMRQLAGLKAPPLTRHPAFWLVAMCWVLGRETLRFWEDWGAPALMVLIASDLQLLFQARFAADSFRRLLLVCCIATMTYTVTTPDFNSRWTSPLRWQFLTADNPDLKGWMPEKGGIIYSTDMTIFYQTFFKNPNADWRYILGYEPACMADDDYKVFYDFVTGDGNAEALKPWVDKMRPEDRFVTRAPRAAPPGIPRLEWNYGVSGIWIGRLPRADTNGAPVTVPALMPREGSTNSVNSAK
jgi:hypothetical protein